MKTSQQRFVFYLWSILCVLSTQNIFGTGLPTKKSSFLSQKGVCTSFKNGAMLATHGFTYIEEGVGGFLVPTKSETEFQQIWEQARKSGLPIRACNGFIPAGMKSVGLDAVHGDILTFAETAFRRAKTAGVKTIVFGSGGSRSIPEGFSPDSARQQFIGLLKAMGPLAAQYDVVVVVEPLNKKECNFINAVSEGGEIVKAVNHPNIQLLADIYHMMMDGEGPESILKYGRLIKHVHVAELEGRSAPGTHNEDLSSYYKALKKVGYKGAISIEGRWENMESQAAKAIETISKQANSQKIK